MSSNPPDEHAPRSTDGANASPVGRSSRAPDDVAQHSLPTLLEKEEPAAAKGSATGMAAQRKISGTLEIALEGNDCNHFSAATITGGWLEATDGTRFALSPGGKISSVIVPSENDKTTRVVGLATSQKEKENEPEPTPPEIIASVNENKLLLGDENKNFYPDEDEDKKKDHEKKNSRELEGLLFEDFDGLSSIGKNSPGDCELELDGAPEFEESEKVEENNKVKEMHTVRDEAKTKQMNDRHQKTPAAEVGAQGAAELLPFPKKRDFFAGELLGQRLPDPTFAAIDFHANPPSPPDTRERSCFDQKAEDEREDIFRAVCNAVERRNGMGMDPRQGLGPLRERSASAVITGRDAYTRTEWEDGLLYEWLEDQKKKPKGGYSRPRVPKCFSPFISKFGDEYFDLDDSEDLLHLQSENDSEHSQLDLADKNRCIKTCSIWSRGEAESDTLAHNTSGGIMAGGASVHAEMKKARVPGSEFAFSSKDIFTDQQNGNTTTETKAKISPSSLRHNILPSVEVDTGDLEMEDKFSTNSTRGHRNNPINAASSSSTSTSTAVNFLNKKATPAAGADSDPSSSVDDSWLDENGEKMSVAAYWYKRSSKKVAARAQAKLAQKKSGSGEDNEKSELVEDQKVEEDSECEEEEENDGGSKIENCSGEEKGEDQDSDL
ncbi:unnamed protein product [Amoebophrya sp. A120]|nr:unnamed protein product [Amoebophrya sp. A120]|eukprot:GSA120T00011589001.1